MNFTYVFKLEYGKCKRLLRNCSQIGIPATFHEIPIVLLGMCKFYTHISADKQNMFVSRKCTRTVTLFISLSIELL
jgi:hypothetical protein